MDAFGSRMRVAVLTALNVHGPSTKAELLRLIGGSDSNLGGHLGALEHVGAIVADPSRQDEAGPVTRRYDVDRKRVAALLEGLSAAVAPVGRQG